MKKEKNNSIKVQHYESPCGLLLLGSFGDKLCLCDWQVEKHRDHVDRRLKRMLCAEFEVGTSEVIEKAAKQLDEFFAGKRKEFDLPLRWYGLSKGCVERTVENTFRKDGLLWRNGLAYRYAQSCPCGCQCQRRKFHIDIRTLSSGDRQ